MNENLKKKGSNVKKIFLWILAVLLLAGVIILIYWFKTDPKAPEKFINVAGGFVIMGIILGIGYLTSRKRRGDDSGSWDTSDPD
jgi:flagellar basal body-associated protein FliL